MTVVNIKGLACSQAKPLFIGTVKNKITPCGHMNKFG